jgi:hypothetical protein
VHPRAFKGSVERFVVDGAGGVCNGGIGHNGFDIISHCPSRS